VTFCPAKRAWLVTLPTRYHSGRQFRVTTTGREETAASAADLGAEADAIAADAEVEAAVVAAAGDSGEAVPAAEGAEEVHAEIETGVQAEGICLHRNMPRHIRRFPSAGTKAGPASRPQRQRKGTSRSCYPANRWQNITSAMPPAHPGR
jgi:hypothetical protein